MKNRCALVAVLSFTAVWPSFASDLARAIQKDYDEYLWPLFDHFHRNPELSLVEFETAK